MDVLAVYIGYITNSVTELYKNNYNALLAAKKWNKNVRIFMVSIRPVNYYTVATIYIADIRLKFQLSVSGEKNIIYMKSTFMKNIHS